MFAHYFRSSPGSVRSGRVKQSLRQWSCRAATLSVLGSTLAACAAAPAAPLAGPDPSHPDVRVPPARYRSTIGTYLRQRPVEPGPWGEQNQRVTPQPKQ
jgi:hypothetical protein